ncbi:hypothetical protein BGX26_002185, partial [Mortierella sp. AD094]
YLCHRIASQDPELPQTFCAIGGSTIYTINISINSDRMSNLTTPATNHPRGNGP